MRVMIMKVRKRDHMKVMIMREKRLDHMDQLIWLSVMIRIICTADLILTTGCHRRRHG